MREDRGAGFDPAFVLGLAAITAFAVLMVAIEIWG